MMIDIPYNSEMRKFISKDDSDLSYDMNSKVIIETSDEGVWIFDKNHNSIYINQKMADMLGYSIDEIMTIEWNKLTFNDDLSDIQEKMDSVFSGKQSIYERRLKHKNGTTIWAYVSARPIIDENIFIGYSCIYTDITKKKLTEDQLKFQSMLLDQIHDQITATDLNGNITYVNYAQQLLLKRSYDELIGSNISVLGKNTIKGDSQEYILNKTKELGKLVGEVINYDSEGNEILLEYRTQLLYDVANKPSGLIGISTDITNKKRTEAQLLKSQELLSSVQTAQSKYIVDGNAQEIFDYLLNTLMKLTNSEIGFINEIYIDNNNQKKILNLAKASHAKLDYSKLVDLIIDNYYKIIKKNDIDSIDELLIDNNVDSINYRLHLTEYYSQIKNFIRMPLFFGGEVVGIAALANSSNGYSNELYTFLEPFVSTCSGIIHAIRTNKNEKKVIDALKESEKKYRHLFENLVSGFSFQKVICNSHGLPIDFIFLEINSAFEKLTGWKRDIVIGKKISELVPEQSPKFIETFAEVAINGQAMQFEKYSFYFKKYFRLSVFCPQKKYFACVFDDITEIKQYELQLINAKEKAEAANKAKNDFLANISHELRTPLNGINGFTDLLLNDIDITEEQREFINIIKLSASNLTNIIQDLLDFSRIISGKLNITKSQFNLKYLIQNIITQVRPQATQKQLSITSNCPNNCELFYGDKTRIAQIILNLMTNAIKYTKQGSIHLNIETKDELLISVIDTGIGISEEKMELIFEPFKQLEDPYSKTHQGLGLGLSIVKQLVNLMDGRIEVFSQLNQGTSFHVYFPIIEDTATLKNNINAIINNTTKDFSNFSVLIVEDDYSNMMLVEKILKNYNLKLDKAINGYQAVQKFQNNNYNIILMDIGLPVMNGIEATTHIRQLEQNTNKSVPIIALTAHAYNSDKQKCLDAGMNDYISKPLNENKLKEILFNYLLE